MKLLYTVFNISWLWKAHVELITGWELNKGPCGNTCSEQSVNLLTNAQRDKMEQTDGKFNCFGNFFSKYKNTGSKNPTERDLNRVVHQNYTERVIAVSENAHWEQELMTFSIEMEKEKEDIAYDFYAKLT
jgi:hypothetical protein